LAIFLLKTGRERPSLCIKEPESLAVFPVSDGSGELGRLYVERRSDNPPRWGRFFHPQVRLAELGHVSSTAAVLHIPMGDRAVAVTFGHGRHLLQPYCWEERFGLKATLNSIGEEHIRSLDAQTLDTFGRHTRVQLSKQSSAGEFGIDIERDVLRAITGRPEDPSLGSTLSGFDALHADVHVTLPILRALLERYIEQSEKDTFRERFSWVEHVSEIKDPALVDVLDDLMISEIGYGRRDKSWLALPEPIDWSRTAGFRYGLSANI
jgi:uncharacterized protein (TIGR04141 family)